MQQLPYRNDGELRLPQRRETHDDIDDPGVLIGLGHRGATRHVRSDRPWRRRWCGADAVRLWQLFPRVLQHLSLFDRITDRQRRTRGASQARQRLETGGAAVSASPISSPGSPADSHDFLLPLDIDADEVVKAIQAKLGDRDDGSTRAPPLLARRAGGRVAVWAITFCGSAMVGSISAGASCTPLFGRSVAGGCGATDAGHNDPPWSDAFPRQRQAVSEAGAGWAVLPSPDALMSDGARFTSHTTKVIR